jgi:adenylate cyclase
MLRVARMSRTALQDLRRLWWLPLLCFGAAFGLSRVRLARALEWHTLDWRTEFRALFQPPPDPRLVVVLYEDSTDANIASWPPDREWHGNFNELISLTHPAVVTWDIIFDTSREGGGDAKMGLGMQAAIERGTQVVVGASTTHDPPDVRPGPDGPTRPLTHVEGDASRIEGDDYALIPFPELRAVCKYGIVDAPRASDGIIREVPLVARVGRQVYPSFGLQTLMCYLHVAADDVRVRLGDAVYLSTKTRTLRIPIGPDGRYLLNYRYDQPDFPTHTYAEILLKTNAYFVEKTPGAPRPPDLAGKIVFVGQTVTGKADAGPTPLNAYAPLVLVNANVVANILAGDYVRQVPPAALWLAALLAGYAAMLLLADRSVILLFGGTVLGVVAYGSLALWAWVLGSVWLPVVAPLGGFVVLQFLVTGRRVLQEQRARQEIKGMFGTYVSPHLVEQLIKAGERPKLGGHEAEITAYFSDIQSFSSFSEKLPADRLVELMNEYLTACTDIVLEEGGSLDKYIGDAVVAMFGAPVPLPDHALRACVAAQRTQARLAELRAKWKSEGDQWPEIVTVMRSRIGLNTGRCIIGNMGSRTRFNYTMMGDDVNLAARMESGAKSWGVYTMCTEATRLACEQHGADRLVFRTLGRIVVKGRTRAVPIHEIVGLAESVTADTRECVGLFAQGLERYYARDWDGALALFRRSAALEPIVPGQTPGVISNPSLVYLGIVEHYKIDPPPPDWAGVYVMKEK